MSHPSRSLSPTDVIGDAFSIYKRFPGPLLLLALALYAVPVIGGIIVAILAFGGSTAGDGAVIGVLVVGVPLVIVAFVVAALVYAASVTNLVRDVQDGELDASVGQLLASTKPVIGKLLLAGLLSGLIILIGLVFLIIPGIIAIVLLAVVGPVVIVERLGVVASLRRSRELVRGNAWPVFGVFLLLVLISIVIGIITSIIGAVVGQDLEQLLDNIANFLLLPLQTLALSVLYFRLRSLHGDAPASSDFTAAG